jgi:hypothetical protein
MTLRFALAAGSIGAALLSAALAACSSGTQTTSGALVDGSTNSSGEGGANPSAVAAYCQQATALLKSCGAYDSVSPACANAIQNAESQSCPAVLAAQYNDSFFKFSAECGYFSQDCSCVTGTCSEAGVEGESKYQQCMAKNVATLMPNAAAMMLESNFCASCPDDASAVPGCSGFFALGDSGVGLGSFALLQQDSVTNRMDMECTGAALGQFDAGAMVTDCVAKFVRCVAMVQAQLGGDAGAPPPECMGEGGAAD